MKITQKQATKQGFTIDSYANIGYKGHRFAPNEIVNLFTPIENELLEAARQAVLQIEYLHEKFEKTGTGNAVLAQLKAVIHKAETE